MRCRSLISMLFGVAVLPLFSFAETTPTITPVIPQQDAADNCYKIGTAAELYGFAKMVNEGDGNYVCGKLTADICVNACGEGESVLDADGNLNGGSSFTPWTPIGTDLNKFKGEFHGQGHTVSGLYNTSSGDYIGLIGKAAEVTVDSVGLLDSYFIGNKYVGGLVGFAAKLTIENSYNTGVVKGYDSYFGGFAGFVGETLTIKNSYNSGSVGPVLTSWFRQTGDDDAQYVGGFVGAGGNVTISDSHNEGNVEARIWTGGFVGFVGRTLTIENSYNKGSVQASRGGMFLDDESRYVGGFVGYALDSLNVVNSYNSGFVKGVDEYVGGFVGYVSENAVLTISDSYNSGFVKGVDEYVGGFVGYASEKAVLTISDSHNEGDVEGVNGHVGGLVGGVSDTLNVVNSYNSGFVNGENILGKDARGEGFTGCVGGLVGSAGSLFISGSYNMGIVKGDTRVGGFAGHVSRVLTINDSYNTNEVNGNRYYVGGFVGRFYSSNSGVLTIENSYNTGSVHGIGVVGGFAGESYGEKKSSMIIKNSSNAGTVSGGDEIGGLAGDVSTDTLKVFNSYNTGTVSSGDSHGAFVGELVANTAGFVNSYSAVQGVAIVGSIVKGEVYNYNVFYVDEAHSGDCSDGQDGQCGRTIEEFADGTVAKKLHEFCSNNANLCSRYGKGGSSIWGQIFGREDLPTLSGIIGYPLVLHTFDGNVINSAYYEKTDLLTPKRKDYAFMGWFANEACANGTSEDACSAVTKFPSSTTGEQHLYARWSKNPPLVDGCYEIANADQLFTFAALVNTGEAVACGRLVDDIKVNDHVLKDGALNGDGRNFIPWTPIGTQNNPFKGEFHGQGHTISGLYFKGSNEDYIGLFGSVQGVNVVIDGVGLLDSYFSGKNYVGGIVGSARKSLTISDSYNTGFVSGSSYVGGIVGYQFGTVGETSSLTITNSYNAGEVSRNTNNAFGTAYVGGIVGYQFGNVGGTSSLTITNSYNVGSVNKKMGNAIFGGNSSSGLLIDRVFYLEGSGNGYTGAKPKSVTEFANGSVALLLRGYQESGCTENCINGSVWGQNIGVDTIPNLNGRVLSPVVLDAKGGSIAPSAQIEYADYEAATALPTANDVTREHYVFQGWFADEACADGTSEMECSAVTTIPKETLSKQTFFAKWIVEKYSVKWTVDGKVVQEDKLEYLAVPEYKGETPVKDTVGNLAYEFTDWASDIEGWEKSMGVTSDMTFTAQFKESVVPKSSSSVKSSSSSAASSSSVKSSSSSAKSSSSVKSSSSTAKSSSSAKSSNSSAKSSSSVKSSSSTAKSSSSVKSSNSSAKSSSSVKSSGSSAKSSSSVKSSGSSAKSSSSVKLSSSTAKSSSSVKSSSSTAKSSSSVKSSSSTAKSGKSSSSGKKDALEIAIAVPQFSVNVVGRSLQVAGAKVGTSLIVFDMQGKVVFTSNVNAANFAVDLPHAGGYLVRVGLQTNRVNVR